MSSVEKSVQITLLKQLPTELQERWKDSLIEKINKIIDARKESGFETLTGYHTYDIDLNVGDYIRPGSDGTIHCTTSPDTLYGKKAKYLYIVEGSTNDIINDKNLEWRQSHAQMKITNKIELTPDKAEELNTSFADIKYSG